MAKKTMNQRKQLLIDPGFQTSFLAYTVGTAISVILIFFAATRYFFWRFEDRGHQLGLPDGHIFFHFLADQKLQMDVILFLASILVTGVIGFYGLYLSNRVAGPIYHLKKYLRAHNDGEKVAGLKFREKDFFQDLAPLVSRAVSGHKKSNRLQSVRRRKAA